MNAATLLDAVRSLGGQVDVRAGDRLRVTAPAPLPDPIMAALRREKPEVLMLLRDLHREAAALVQDSSINQMRTGVMQLRPEDPPMDFDSKMWRAVVRSARQLQNVWALQGFALGWSLEELFGAHPTHPCARVDAAGLVRFFHRGTLIALDENIATLRTTNDSVLRFRRNPRPEAVPIWNLGS